MIPYTLDNTGFQTKIAWGVNYNAEDRLFVFYMTPASCIGNDKASNCLFVNSVRFSMTTKIFSIQQDNCVELKLVHATIQKSIKIYPGSI